VERVATAMLKESSIRWVVLVKVVHRLDKAQSWVTASLLGNSVGAGGVVTDIVTVVGKRGFESKALLQSDEKTKLKSWSHILRKRFRPKKIFFAFAKPRRIFTVSHGIWERQYHKSVRTCHLH
jgi:hypothetical protein